MVTSTVVQAGKYRRRVTIQKPIQVQDSTGGAIPDWEDFAVDIRASIDPLTGKQTFFAQQIQADITDSISFRYRPGVDQSMRILHTLDWDASPPEVEIFSIESVMMDSTGRKEITCLCRKRMNQGFRSDG